MSDHFCKEGAFADQLKFFQILKKRCHRIIAVSSKIGCLFKWDPGHFCRKQWFNAKCFSKLVIGNAA